MALATPELAAGPMSYFGLCYLMTQLLYASQHPARLLENGRYRFGEIANFWCGYRPRNPGKPTIWSHLETR
jgi:hypothetical protein